MVILTLLGPKVNYLLAHKMRKSACSGLITAAQSKTAATAWTHPGRIGPTATSVGPACVDRRDPIRVADMTPPVTATSTVELAALICRIWLSFFEPRGFGATISCLLLV